MLFLRIPLVIAAALAPCFWLIGCAEPADPGVPGCLLPDGTPVDVGASAPAGDGCNECVCNSDVELVCSTRTCLPLDGGTEQPVDGGPDATDGGTDPGEDGGVLARCVDADLDGFYTCVDARFPERPTAIDCDDERFHVQPGGIEFPETSEDDNCNGTATDWADCPCPDGDAAADLAAAFDLCDGSVQSASRVGNARQLAAIPDFDGVIMPRTRVQLDPSGGPPTPIGNACLAALSSGDADGVGLTQGEQTDPQSVGFDVFCDGNDPDPQHLDANPAICDLAQAKYRLRVPPNAQGFAIDFMFLSYEWPEYLCQSYNDTFYVLVETPVVAEGEPTNAAFDPQGRPITVNVGFFEQPLDWSISLEGTDYAAHTGDVCAFPSAEQCTLPAYCDGLSDGRAGSGSGWLTTTVPVTPGQQDLPLTLSIHDESDAAYDSRVIIDSFRWLPYTPTLETGKGP